MGQASVFRSDVPKWCQNGTWLANWPELIFFKMHPRRNTQKCLSFHQKQIIGSFKSFWLLCTGLGQIGGGGGHAHLAASTTIYTARGKDPLAGLELPRGRPSHAPCLGWAKASPYRHWWVSPVLSASLGGLVPLPVWLRAQHAGRGGGQVGLPLDEP